MPLQQLYRDMSCKTYICNDGIYMVACTACLFLENPFSVSASGLVLQSWYESSTGRPTFLFTPNEGLTQMTQVLLTSRFNIYI